ncbi:hypothetical protein L1887_11568 [Cichorium endivia]|nr:hypothetical protein L1887_11568 [Cichorium endivia]
MAVKLSKMQKKVNYDAKLSKLLDHYTQILVVGADNVGSNQLQNIRQGLRGDSIVLMGKKTMMKRTIRLYAQKTNNTDILNLVPLLVGNVGLVFMKGDLKEVSDIVAKYKVIKSKSIHQFFDPVSNQIESKEGRTVSWRKYLDIVESWSREDEGGVRRKAEAEPEAEKR